MSEGWSLTESDPAIFTALISELGVKGAQVEELWSLDKSALDELEPVFGLIFLFKYVASHGSDPTKQVGKQEEPPEGTWFAHQVINNACATLALLNATMNIPSTSGFQLGDELENLKAFSTGLDPQTTGEVLTNAEKIREVHNSFARSNPFHLDEPQDSSSEDVYHFITYIPIGNKVYELDGLKDLPVSHGEIPAGTTWTEKAQAVVEERIGMYATGELHFNLMAICGDRLTTLQNRSDAVAAKLTGTLTAGQKATLEDERAVLGEKLAQEREKREGWNFDNKIRRHNHVGLAHALLVSLAQAGKLEAQVEVAKEKMKEKKAKARERGLSGMDMED